MIIFLPAKSPVTFSIVRRRKKRLRPTDAPTHRAATQRRLGTGCQLRTSLTRTADGEVATSWTGECPLGELGSAWPRGPCREVRAECRGAPKDHHPRAGGDEKTTVGLEYSFYMFFMFLPQ